MVYFSAGASFHVVYQSLGQMRARGNFAELLALVTAFKPQGLAKLFKKRASDVRFGNFCHFQLLKKFCLKQNHPLKKGWRSYKLYRDSVLIRPLKAAYIAPSSNKGGYEFLYKEFVYSAERITDPLGRNNYREVL